MRDVVRTCIGCRGRFLQKTLIRFVCQGNETLRIDEQKKAGGRGAYVCWSQSCIQKAFKSSKRMNALLRSELASRVIAQFEQVLLEYARKSGNSIGKKGELL